MIDQDRDEIWRDLCQKAETEQDPDRLTALVAEIISAFDNRNEKADPRTQKKQDSRETSFPRPAAIAQPKDQLCERV